jgi:hypothetical protein
MEARNDFDIDLEGGLEDEVSSLKDEGGRPRFLGLGMVSVLWSVRLSRTERLTCSSVCKRTPTVLSNSSKRSFSTRPIQLIKRRMCSESRVEWICGDTDQFPVTNSSQVVPEQAQPRISDGRELILFLGENQPRTVSFKNACDWYVTFLDCKCKTFWHLIQPVVVGVKERTPAPDAEDLDKVDHVLMTIARVLSKKKEFALVDIVDDLMNDGLIRDTTDDRVPSLQLLFTFMGWLSTLMSFT